MRGWLATTAVLLVAACDPKPGPDACYGVCGEGTKCEAGKCVVAELEAPEPEPEPTSGKKKRRRRRKGSSAPKDGGGGFKAEDDSNVPGYDPKAAKGLDMDAGTERLADRTIRQHLSRLEPKFNKCIEKSALAHDEGLKGELDFVLSIEPSGKVGGVTVKASGNLKKAGVVPCARKVVYGHRFPSFDGSTMGVDYSFKVD
ncbi:MAG: AgmX/PglI C-terminal domain-containing protein [Nannocystales bacterium]